MFLGFRLEKFKNLVRHFLVAGQSVKIGSRRGSHGGFFLRKRGGRGRRWRLQIIERRRLGWKRKAVAFFKRCNVVDTFVARVADLEKIRLQHRNSVGKKLDEWPVQVIPERRVRRILENMCQFARDLRKTRKPVAR